MVLSLEPRIIRLAQCLGESNEQQIFTKPRRARRFLRNHSCSSCLRVFVMNSDRLASGGWCRTSVRGTLAGQLATQPRPGETKIVAHHVDRSTRDLGGLLGSHASEIVHLDDLSQ